MGRVASRRFAALVALAIGCSDPASDPAPVAPVAPAAPEPSAEPVVEPAPIPPIEGLEGLDEAVRPEEVVPSEALGTARPDGDHSCVIVSETRTVLEHATAGASVAGYLGQLVVVAYTDDGSEALSIARVNAGAPPELVTRIPLESRVAVRTAPPGVAMHGTSTLVAAVTDGRGRVLVTELDVATGGTAGRFVLTIEDAHADARFSPAVVVAADGTRVVAWTDGSGTPMTVRLARFSPSGALLGDPVTISADGGGAAPVVGIGETERALYLVEARVAMSVVHRVALGPDGTPAAALVARPISRGADLPAIAVVRAPAGTRNHLAYAAVGNLASRAIGLVQTTGTDAPQALVPGLGYGGALSLRGAPLSRSVVFAMEAPSDAVPDAPHEVRVRVAADDGALGPALVLAGQLAPDVTSLGELVGVVTRGARVTFLRCRD